MSQAHRSFRASGLALLVSLVRVAALTCSAALGAACTSGAPPIADCEARDGIEPLCGFQNPEDLARLPGTDWLVVSQMHRASSAGGLVLWNATTGARMAGYPGDRPNDQPDTAWGDAACPGPIGSALDPHGIDLRATVDGSRLLVVNHGGRESIEWFAIDTSQEAPQLIWKGCAVAPDGTSLNDVAALDGDDLVATHMVTPNRAGQVFALVKSLLGFSTGHVLQWSREGGFAILPGSSANLPNGIATSERWIFVNAYGGGELLRFARPSGELTRVPLPAGDNLSWADDGRLLAASHRAGVNQVLACGSLESGSCPFAFAVVAIDPESLATQVVLEHAGAPMGGVTVALQLGNDLYLGTFAGDRIARVPGAWPPPAPAP